MPWSSGGTRATTRCRRSPHVPLWSRSRHGTHWRAEELATPLEFPAVARRGQAPRRRTPTSEFPIREISLAGPPSGSRIGSTSERAGNGRGGGLDEVVRVRLGCRFGEGPGGRAPESWRGVLSGIRPTGGRRSRETDVESHTFNLDTVDRDGAVAAPCWPSRASRSPKGAAARRGGWLGRSARPAGPVPVNRSLACYEQTIGRDFLSGSVVLSRGSRRSSVRVTTERAFRWSTSPRFRS